MVIWDDVVGLLIVGWLICLFWCYDYFVCFSLLQLVTGLLLFLLLAVVYCGVLLCYVCLLTDFMLIVLFITLLWLFEDSVVFCYL